MKHNQDCPVHSGRPCDCGAEAMQAEAPAVPKEAPPFMADAHGNVLQVGDRIRHPDGETATVTLDPSREGCGQWRAVYSNGDFLFLGNQINNRGQAIKLAPSPAASTPDSVSDPKGAS